MSTNPFYRFENSAWNTAFEPAFTPTVDALYDFIVNVFDGLFVGSSLSFAVTFIKNKIILRNAPPYHFNFELIAPSPLPPVGSGTQYWSYYITEKQLYSLHPTQKFQIDFTTVNGIITVTNVTANPDISYPYSYSLPLFQTEIEAYRALEIAHQNGAAFFPSEYTYDSTTGIATSSVARLQDCKFNEETGFGERYPLITAPVSPYWGLSVPAMSADEKYMILLLNKIITYGLDSTKTAIDINIFVNNLILPEGYYVLGGYDLTGYPRVQYTFSNPTTRKAVGLIGRFDVLWNWQRFYSAGIDNFFTSNLAVMEATSPTTPLPYPPILGKSYSTEIEEKKNWYDFEQMEFIDACAIPVEYYPMPAKTADHLQFNVIPSMSNTNDLNYSKIGLFDCQENFIQEIGEARLDCYRSDTDNVSFEDFTIDRSLLNLDNGIPINIGFYITSTLPSSTEFIGNTNVTPTIFNTNDELIDYLINLSDSNNILEVVDVTGPPVQTTCITTNTKSFTAAEALDLENLIKSYIGTIYPDLGFTNSYEGVVYSYYTPIDEFFTISDLIAWGEDSGIPGFLITSGVEEGSLIFTWEIENDCGTGNITSQWIMYDPITQYDVNLFTTNPASCTCDETPTINYDSTFTKNKKYCDSDYTITCGYALSSTPNVIKATFFSFEIPLDSSCFLTQFQASIDIPSVATGEYKLGLYNQSESALEIYSTSNPIRIDNSDCFSNIIEFYGNPSSIAQGFEYYGDWRQRIRVGLNGGGAKPRITEATYRQSNGVFKRPQNKQDLTLDLHTDFFDELTQFAMTDATRHPFLVWNDKNIFVEGDIEVATVQDFTTQSSFEDLAQMKFSVLVQGFQPKNNSCINC